MIKLTAVTFTDGTRETELARAVSSVSAGLRAVDEHVIERGITPENFVSRRWDLRKYSDVIAHVDDDDFIEPEAIAMCMRALEETGAGCAFTNERVQKETGEVIVINQGTRRWIDFMLSPQKIHHLVVFNPRLVPEEAFDLASKTGVGIDWLMKSGAAIFGGAVHVPVIGYNWIQRDGQMSREPTNQRKHLENHTKMARMIEGWLKQTGRNMFEEIPCFSG